MAVPTISSEAELADRAVVQRLSASHLPASLREGAEAIQNAFYYYERSRDERARAELKKISSRSPFADWSLLLRGLLAWNRSDDATAREYWCRLNPARRPAQLIAPLRMTIDDEFRSAQTDAARASLDNRKEKLIGDRVLFPALRTIRQDLNKEEGLAEAFRTARQVARPLGKKHPDLADRLANCLYWAILDHGQPDDLRRYRKAFGPPSEDPEFTRLEAMVMEAINDLDTSNKLWDRYAHWLKSSAKGWPPDQIALAAALIRHRMGMNAQRHLDLPSIRQTPGFLEFLREMLDTPHEKRQPLKPGAEECFREAMTLCPDWPGPAVELLSLYIQENAKTKAAKLARFLQERFPEHVPALEILSDFYMNIGDHDSAAKVLTELQRRNPLDREVRVQLGLMIQARGLALGMKGKFDEARTELERSLAYFVGAVERATLCSLSVLERLQGNDEAAQKWLDRASTGESVQAALTYHQLVEVIRFKLPRAVKKQFDDEFASVLSGQMTLASATNLLVALSLYLNEPTAYRGLKTHQKKITDKLRSVLDSPASEDEFIECGMVLWRMKLARFLEMCARNGSKRYPRSPFFDWMLAERFMLDGRSGPSSYRVYHHLTNAHRLLTGRPDDERHKWLREQVSERRREYQSGNPFMMFGFDPFEEEYDP